MILAAEITDLGAICITLIILTFMGCVTYLWRHGDFD